MVDMQSLSKQDFVSDQDVRWCPGCGDYAILSQVQKIFPNLDVVEAPSTYQAVGGGGLGCMTQQIPE
mgnify:CR=1 FL=1